MSKELEAYRRLCIHLNYKDDYLFNGSFNEDDEIIETALKDYEKSKKVKSYKKLKEIYSTLKKDRDLYLVFEKQYGREDCYYKRFSQLSSNNQKSKELKALEIIKKYLDCSIFIKQLEKHCDDKTIDLLKEVLYE